MKTLAAIVAAAALSAIASAQERKPVPKDSVRVALPGCTRGHVFTAGQRTVDEPGSFSVPEGTHIRMNGPKKLMTEIKTHEGSMIELTGLMKKSQYSPGVTVGGIRIAPAPSGPGGAMASPVATQMQIDVEGWRPVAGDCRR